MRFLANENFPRSAVQALRAAGHDVAWIRTDRPGARDTDVLAWAQREQRLLLTFDKDFGELAFRNPQDARHGILLFRIDPSSPEAVAKRTVDVVLSRDDWVGHFAVVETDRVRMTPLPSD